MKKRSHAPAGSSESEQRKVSFSVPAAILRENQAKATHSRSHAAHLDGANEEPHTKPAGDLRAVSYPGARKRPDGDHGR